MMTQPLVELPAEDVFASTKKIRYVLDRIERYREVVDRPPRVLDFGCGNGVALSQYVISAGVDYIGVDMHRPSLDYARDHFGGGNARFLSGFPDSESFDILIYSEILEHLDDPGAVLRAHRLALRPGGIVLGSIPNGYGLTEIEKYVDRKLRLYPMLRWFWRGIGFGSQREFDNPIPYNHASGHVQFFTKRSLLRTAQSAGYRLVDLRNGSVMGADLSGATLLRPQTLRNLNTRLADYLPAWASATWHFTLVPAEN